jgi:VanZ family protein
MSDTTRKSAGREGHQWDSRIWRYAPLVLWLAAIFFASTDEFSASRTASIIEPLLRWVFPHLTSKHIAAVHFFVRKAGHFSEYAILGSLAARAFSSSRLRFLRGHWFLASLVLLIVYALLDEFHQSFVPSRTASIYDSMIDISGGVTALPLFAGWQVLRRRRQSRSSTNIDSKLFSIEA